MTTRRASAAARPTAATPATGLSRATNGAAGLVADWGLTAGRLLLGLVLAWFGYHELVQPGLWTGYLPLVHTVSSAAVVLVLAHGWVLLVLAVALLTGIAPRLAAAVTAVLILEIVISLLASGGLSDLTMRDLGVLGLALCVAGASHQRLVLRR